MSDSLWPHGLQHARLPCPSLSPRVCSNSCPLSRWCHPTISSSVALFSCPQYFLASGSFLMRQRFAPGGQIIGASTSASVFPMNIQGWFPLGLTGLISLLSVGLSRIFSSTTVQKHQSFCAQHISHMFSHLYMTTGKTTALTIPIFVSKVMSLLCNTLFRFVIAFLPRSKHLLISRLQSLSTIFGAQENKVCHCLHCFPICLSWSNGIRCHNLSFFKPAFSLSFIHREAL